MLYFVKKYILREYISMRIKLYRLSVGMGTCGLLFLIAVMLTNAQYPDPVYRLASAGIILVFLSAGLFAVDWALRIKEGVRQKKYGKAVLLLLLGLLFIVFQCIKR